MYYTAQLVTLNLNIIGLISIFETQILIEIRGLLTNLLPNNQYFSFQFKPGALPGNKHNASLYLSPKCFYYLPNFAQSGYSINFPTKDKLAGKVMN